MSFPQPFNDDTSHEAPKAGLPPLRPRPSDGMTTAPNKPADTAPADTKPLSAYETRLRREVDSFQFDALLQGIQTGEKPGDKPAVRGLESPPPPLIRIRTRPRRVRFLRFLRSERSPLRKPRRGEREICLLVGQDLSPFRRRHWFLV